MKGKILIACYSYSGNTRRIAEEIRNQTGGTLCPIYPSQPYPASFERLLRKVREEISSGTRPPLLPVSESAEKYDIIFAGSPNWCGTIAPPLASWLYRNDLRGKVLIPFFSHCGGDRGNTEKDLKELCPEARLGESLYVLDDGNERLQDVIRTWLGKNLNDMKTA